MTDLPVLELGSDAYERGLTHGRALRVQIAENIDTYLARFAAGGLDALHPAWKLGNLAKPRMLEVHAALSRLRGLAVPQTRPPPNK